MDERNSLSILVIQQFKRCLTDHSRLALLRSWFYFTLLAVNRFYKQKILSA